MFDEVVNYFEYDVSVLRCFAMQKLPVGFEWLFLFYV